MSNAISLADMRFRSAQEGDIPATYPGHQTNRTGPHEVFINKAKWRAHQNVVWFEDDIAEAPNIPFGGRAGISITGAITRKGTDSWEGYGVPTFWAKFKAPYSGLYSFACEKLDGKDTTAINGSGNPLDGFVPNIELWLPFTDQTPTGYGDIQSFPAFAWPYDPPDQFNMIAGRTYYILAYSFHFGGFYPTEIEQDGSFVINIQPLAFNTTATAPQNSLFSAGVLLNPRGWIGGQNVNSTTEFAEPLHPEGSGNTVWFLIQSLHLGQKTLRINREWGAEHTISVYSDEFGGGLSFSTLTLIGHSSTTPAEITFNGELKNYFIQIDAKNNQEGGFILEWDMPEPPGNRIEDPIQLGNGTSITRLSDHNHGSDSQITDDPWGEEDLDTWQAGDYSTIWYRWTAPSDGWTTCYFTHLPLTPVDSQEIKVFKGETFEELQQVAATNFENPIDATRTADWPAKQGQVYMIRYNSLDEGRTFNFGLTHNSAHTPANLTFPDITHSTEGSFTRMQFYATDNPYRLKPVYISWWMRYGNENHITPGADTSIFFGRILDSALGTRINLSMNQSARSWRLGDDGITANSLEGSQLTQEWSHCEIFFHGERNVFSFFVNGRQIGSEGLGSTFGTDGCYLDLGLLQDDLHRGTSIEFKDIKIRDVYNRDFNYKPEVPLFSPHYVTFFEGYSHGLPTTGWPTSPWEDWGGYSGDSASTFSRTIAVPAWWGKGRSEDTSRGKALRVSQNDYIQPSLTNFTSTFNRPVSLVHTFGAWCYLESLPPLVNDDPETSHTTFIGLTGSSNQNDNPAMYIDFEGNLFVRGVGSFRKYMKRRIDLNRWHYIEIVYDNRHPVLLWKIYLNEELIYEGVPFPWKPVEDSEQSMPLPTFFGVGSSGTLWTDMVGGLGFEGRLGPYKTALIKPNASIDLVHLNSAGVGWWKSEDDGLTMTELSLGDAPHTYVNAWPFIRNFEGTPAPIRCLFQDFTFNTGAISYVEVGFEDMPAGEIPVSLRILQAYRGWDKPLGNDYESEGASDADLLLGGETVTSNGVNRGCRYLTGEADNNKGALTTLSQETIHPYDYGQKPWTEGVINGLTYRWGFGGGAFAGAGDYGGCLNALAIEVLMRDNYPSLAPYSTIHPPDFEWWTGYLAGDTSVDDFNSPPYTGISQTSCDAYDKRRAPTYSQGVRLERNAVDPYLRGKVWWWIGIEPLIHYGRDDLFTYWRILPFYDMNYPGFDGDFHDTDLDRANKTTSYDMLVRWTKPFGYDWYGVGRIVCFPDYPPHTQIRKTKPLDGDTYTYFYMNLEAPVLLYDPCFDLEKGKLFPDRTWKIEAYRKDAWGNASPINSFTFNLPKGTCCGHINANAKFRAKQDGDLG